MLIISSATLQLKQPKMDKPPHRAVEAEASYPSLCSRGKRRQPWVRSRVEGDGFRDGIPKIGGLKAGARTAHAFK